MRITDQLQQICKTHKLKLKYVNPLNPNDKLLCCLCLDEINTSISIKSKNKEIVKSIRLQLDKNLNAFEQLIDSIKQFEESFIEGITIIDNILEAVGTQIENTKHQIQQLQQQKSQYIFQSYEKYLEEERNFQKNIAEYFEMIKFDKNISELIQKLDELNFQSCDQQNLQQSNTFENIVKQPSFEQNSFEINQDDIKMYEYELLPQSTLKLWGEHCYAMDVNNDVSKVAAGCYHNIKVFYLDNNQLSNPQILKGHDNQVTSIQFFKHCNRFLSTGCDRKINLWQQNNKNEWVVIQNLNLQMTNNKDFIRHLKTASFNTDKQGHFGIINYLIINQNEDMILTGSQDQTIISWILSDDQWIFNQCLECKSEVYSLSLNFSDKKLISCEANNLINVFEIKHNQWILKQNISLESQGFRIGFVSFTEFVFQPEKSKYLLFYKFKYVTQKFEIDYQVEVNSGNQDEKGFPISYIKQKNILIVKNCQYLNILYLQRDGKFILNYSIQFNSHNFYGCISTDGEYLITRDSQAIQYQIRKLKERK